MSAWLEQQASQWSAQAETLTALAKLYQDKLWYQYGQKLLSSVLAEPFFLAEGRALAVFQNAVLPLARNISLTTFAEAAMVAADQTADDAEAVTLLRGLFKHTDKDAAANTMLLAATSLRLTKAGKLAAAAVPLDAARAAIAATTTTTSAASGSAPNARAAALTHLAEARLAQAKGDDAGFYAAALLHLTFSPNTTTPAGLALPATAAFAAEVAAAALRSDATFAFGELVQHSVVVGALANDAALAPLAALLAAFDEGKVQQWEAGKDSLPAPVTAALFVPAADTAAIKARLSEKVRLMALAVNVFARPTQQRCVPAADVAAWCCVAGAAEAERLVIKAIARGIVKAQIDGEKETVRFTWVMPRVLNAAQLAHLRSRVGAWRDAVDAAIALFEEHAAQLVDVQ